jgi:hypothetical protein
MRTGFQPGDLVVYAKQKCSTHPGPRAADVDPAPNGDGYVCLVPRSWKVVGVQPSVGVQVCRRRVKHHTRRADAPAFHRARWWGPLLYRGRFPAPAAGG